MAGERGGAECPIHGPELIARISERRPEFNGAGGFRTTSQQPIRASAGPGRDDPGHPGFSGALDSRGGNTGAIAAPHQDAVLGLAEVGDADGEPDPDRGQRDGKSERCNVGEHPVAEIVGFVRVPLVAGQIVSLLVRMILQILFARLPPRGRRMGQRPRSKFEHTVLIVGWKGLLRFHGCASSGMFTGF